uniref:Uncharacterized protein n=1 Tax=Craspedostauros australis TaxID=1486917 RepID=A0A7R9WXL0_9STRA|mmetsp:Transcript_24372/g.67885  ORF Transcript_24372/g.67885 Transcript_24372/m.67885 type:complete len:164 (+) Transcript_24372:291-782(+)|eukprot:CAMPEP_0198115116 /NCGR_PEP_ID=MMETSP1442-20131203/6309_1 /TAXON_ID= /ORGANISM="Craspedostauros australis, Strain CCMP3328" /LENGTH=163 /DNA_ID=CAMNT_0043772555 /DNA_START=260 /DNA_END=751 /DNA_ORIENTATION=+
MKEHSRTNTRPIALVEAEQDEQPRPKRRKITLSPSSPDLGACLLLSLSRRPNTVTNQTQALQGEDHNEESQTSQPPSQAPILNPLHQPNRLVTEEVAAISDDDDDHNYAYRRTPQTVRKTRNAGIVRHTIYMKNGPNKIVGPMPPAPSLPMVAAGVIIPSMRR